MKFMSNERLYSCTEDCLQFLRGLDDGSQSAVPERELYHLYWYGPFSLKQAFAIKSFLATQDLQTAELWLWLDAERGYEGHEQNSLLKPLLPFLQVKRFDPEFEARDTPLEQRIDLFRGPGPTPQSDFFRFVVLYKYGGTYVDMDTVFLRDMRILGLGPVWWTV